MKNILFTIILVPTLVLAEQKVHDVKGETTNYSTDSLRWFIVIKNSKESRTVEITNKEQVTLGADSHCDISLEYSNKKLSNNFKFKNVRGKTAKCSVFGEKFDLHSVCYEELSKKECSTFEDKTKEGVKIYIRGF